MDEWENLWCKGKEPNVNKIPRKHAGFFNSQNLAGAIICKLDSELREQCPRCRLSWPGIASLDAMQQRVCERLTVNIDIVLTPAAHPIISW